MTDRHRRSGLAGPGAFVLLLAVIASLLTACGAVGPASSAAAPTNAASPVATDIPAPTDTPASAAAAPTATEVPSPASAPSPSPAEPADTSTPASTPTAAPALETPTVVPAPTSVPTGPIQSNPDGQFAILLLGYGGPGHDGPYLTDSMMVVIVDPAKKTVAMLSLPRDSWVPLDFTGGEPSTYDKLNTAYAFAKDSALYPNRLPRYKGPNGAGNMAKATVSQILGIPVAYYFGLDFRGFREMIDTVGGIDVNVSDSFTARYPANDNSSVNANWTTVHFDKGLQHMNGQRALEYARAREVLDNSAEASDFARATRQRLVLTALRDRVLQPSGLIHLPQLLSIATRSSDTDYPLPALTSLLGLILPWSNAQLYQAALSDANFLQDATGPGGTFILVPRAAGHSWSQVQSFARRLWQDPQLGNEMGQTQITVVNRTGKTGLATQVSDRLAALGYAVAPPQTGTISQTTQVIDQSGGKAASIASALSPDLSLPPLQTTVGQKGKASQVTLELGLDSLGVVGTAVPPIERNVPTSDVGVAHLGWRP